MASQEAKRKFLDLKVGEISLVDEPANEKPIIVMKRKETTPMKTNETSDKVTKNAQASADDAEKVTKAETKTDDSDDVEVVEQEAEGTDEVLKGLVSTVEGLASSLGVDLKKAKGKGKAAKAEDDEDKDDKKPAFLKDMEAKKAALVEKLKSAGLEDDAIDDAVKAVFGGSGIKSPSDDAATTPTKKGLDDESAMDFLEQMNSLVSKAKKFTPKRVKALKDVTDKLTALMAEITESGLEKESFGGSGIPATGTGAEAGKVGTPQDASMMGKGAAVEKSADGALDVAKTFSELKDVLKSIKESIDENAKRIEGIEKARMPSNQPPDDNGKNESVKKSAGGFWTGVL